MKILKIAAILVLPFVSMTALSSSTFWTLKAEGGVLAAASGSVGINIKNYQPTSPNPADTVWESCHQNWIYFHQYANGDEIKEKQVDRMFAIALAAEKSNRHLRVNIVRADNGKCYTTQIYDLGY